ncbi:EAL domain-containing protein [Aurantimonas sp. MSK8Z-1]|uniref:putative bifunctional diguanylate cyclase/phosphodiesterase n=1 Tax=Mangrovibrevibacter kandeliae TaxID=2968473 RepID=UPI0021174D5C|nr:EAL domain-containing protein [Aurantimonas sp. MSK8Z-1]MCW4116238.1 EAL domain-containing protein [Aurantimonas sp. MSK8Z-1]
MPFSLQDRLASTRPGLLYAAGGAALGALFCVSGFLIDVQVRRWLHLQADPVHVFTSTTMHVLALVAPFILGYVFLQFGRQRHVNDERLQQLGQLEAQLRDRARLDELTQLSNRSHLIRSLEQGIASREWHARGALVYMLDLDKFKQINDTLGHRAGDLVLAEVARRIQRLCRSEDIPVRLGGDEFVVVRFPEAGERPEDFGQALIASIGSPMDLQNAFLKPGVSVGAARIGVDGGNWSDVLLSADLALYVAKSSGTGSFRPFQPDMRRAKDADAELAVDLRKGLERGDLELHYQPLFSTRTGRVSSVEALCRWRHPTRGLVYPNEFIRLAERNGLIVALGRAVLHKACETAALWPAPVGVAVNLSPLQFEDGNLASLVAGVLAETGLAPGRLDLEVTESLLLEPSPMVQRTMDELRALGVKITMDDFGTGFSSLSTLRRFRFDRLKIDRSFTTELANAETAEIVRTMVRLASTLRMDTVLEGVETEQHELFARLEGLDEVQGYRYAKPMADADLLQLLSAQWPEGEVAAVA